MSRRRLGLIIAGVALTVATANWLVRSYVSGGPGSLPVAGSSSTEPRIVGAASRGDGVELALIAVTETDNSWEIGLDVANQTQKEVFVLQYPESVEFDRESAVLRIGFTYTHSAYLRRDSEALKRPSTGICNVILPRGISIPPGRIVHWQVSVRKGDVPTHDQRLPPVSAAHRILVELAWFEDPPSSRLNCACWPDCTRLLIAKQRGSFDGEWVAPSDGSRSPGRNEHDGPIDK